MNKRVKKKVAKRTLDKAWLQKLNSWIGEDPFKEARLIDSTFVKLSTLQLIKKGKYHPSDRMKRVLDTVMEE